MNEEIKKMKEILDEHEKRIEKIERVIFEGDFEINKELTLPEFIQKCMLNEHKERILSIAYYFEKYQGEKSYSKSNIEEAYATCRMDKPSNISDFTGRMVGEGLLKVAKSDRPKEWTLTQTGIRKVEEEIMKGEK